MSSFSATNKCTCREGACWLLERESFRRRPESNFIEKDIANVNVREYWATAGVPSGSVCRGGSIIHISQSDWGVYFLMSLKAKCEILLFLCSPCSSVRHITQAPPWLREREKRKEGKKKKKKKRKFDWVRKRGPLCQREI